MSATVLGEQRKRLLYGKVHVHCAEFRVLLEKVCGEKKLKLGIVRCGKRFPKCTLILFKCVSSPEPPVYTPQNGGGRNTLPLAVCLAAESHYSLQKVCSILALGPLGGYS